MRWKDEYCLVLLQVAIVVRIKIKPNDSCCSNDMKVMQWAIYKVSTRSVSIYNYIVVNSISVLIDVCLLTALVKLQWRLSWNSHGKWLCILYLQWIFWCINALILILGSKLLRVCWLLEFLENGKLTPNTECQTDVLLSSCENRDIKPINRF